MAQDTVGATSGATSEEHPTPDKRPVWPSWPRRWQRTWQSYGKVLLTLSLVYLASYVLIYVFYGDDLPRLAALGIVSLPVISGLVLSDFLKKCLLG